MHSPNRNSLVALFWAVAISVFFALVLVVTRFPSWISYFLPDWIALVVVYWALVVPGRVGPLVAFIISILFDVLTVRTFGVSGLGLAMLAFIVNSTHQQLRVLSVWQQMVLVGLFVGLYKLLTGWLYGIVTGFTITGEYWYSLLGCMFIWPFLYILLNELRRVMRVR